MTALRRWLAWAAAAVVAWMALAAARVNVLRPADLPNGDVGDYVIRGRRYAAFLFEGDWAGLLSFAATANVHPPVHTLLLGVWIGVFGSTQESTQAFGALMMVAGLGLVAWLGGLAGGTEGRTAGLVAGAVALLTDLAAKLAYAPMTEATALVAMVGALGAWLVALRRPEARWQLGAGVAIALAGLVRYNLVLMLLVPMIVHHGWECGRDLRRWRDARKLLWVAPTLLLFLAWQVHDPRFLPEVRGFLVNVDSGHAFWSWANLGFVPRVFDGLGRRSTLVHPVLGIAFLAGLPPLLLKRDLRLDVGGPRWGVLLHAGTSPPIRALQLFTLAASAAVTIHPYKLIRNVFGITPFFFLLGILPFLGSRVRLGHPAARFGLWAVVAAVGLAHVDAQTATRAIEPYEAYTRDPRVRAVLEAVEDYARGGDYLLVGGWGRPVEPHQFELWMAEHRVPVKTVVHWDDPAARDPTLLLAPPLQAVEGADLLTERARARTTYVLFDMPESVPGQHPRADLVNANARRLEDRFRQLGLVGVYALPLAEAGVRMRVFVVPERAGW